MSHPDDCYHVFHVHVLTVLWWKCSVQIISFKEFTIVKFTIVKFTIVKFTIVEFTIVEKLILFILQSEKLSFYSVG